MSISSGTMTVGILAVMAGLVGAYALRASLMASPVPEQQITQLIVPMATNELPTGRVLTMGDIALVQMTASQFNDRMAKEKISPSEVMMSAEHIIGRTLREAMPQGQPFLTTAVYLEGQGPDISTMLKPGYRATSITIADRNAVLPAEGNMVDVVFRSNPVNKSKDEAGLDIPEATMTLIENLEVLAVKVPKAENTRTPGVLDIRQLNRNTAPPPPYVTVAVTPAQAKILKTVEGRGGLSLVVRSPDDLLGSDRDALTLEELMGLEPPPAPIPPFVTEIYRRGDRQELLFNRSADSLSTATDNRTRPARVAN